MTLHGESMMKNPSVPTDTVLPHVTYQNLDDAMSWLTNTLGFAEHYRYSQPVQGAQMHIGDVWIMLNGTREAMFGSSRNMFGM